MPVLMTNTTITSLVLEDCNLNATVIEPISKFVKKNKVAVLNLSKNSLFGNDDGTNAAKLLTKALKKHPELSYVNLTTTGLGQNNSALKMLIEGSKDINSVIIDDNAVDADGLGIITNTLQKKNAVTEFSMEGLGIGDGESAVAKAKLLKQCLEKNTTLEQLCLGSNNLGTGGRVLSTIMSGMKINASLTHVDLSDNDIRRVPSMKLIAKYLSSNPSLIELNLSNNGVPSKPASLLIESLKKNTTLQHLSLRRNSISDKSTPAFIDALQNNTTLLTLDLQLNNLKVKTGRKPILMAMCDTSSLDSIVNNSNHTCSVLLSDKNYGMSTLENKRARFWQDPSKWINLPFVEMGKINALENEGEKIRYKVVLALTVMNKDLYNPRYFEEVPLELMPKLFELVQQEIGCNNFGKGITGSMKKENTINRLNKVYETIKQWPSFPELFSRGAGKLPKKKKATTLKRKRRVFGDEDADDDDEDWNPNNRRGSKKK